MYRFGFFCFIPAPGGYWGNGTMGGPDFASRKPLILGGGFLQEWTSNNPPGKRGNSGADWKKKRGGSISPIALILNKNQGPPGAFLGPPGSRGTGKQGGSKRRKLVAHAKGSEGKCHKGKGLKADNGGKFGGGAGGGDKFKG